MRFGLDITPAGRWGQPEHIAELAALAERSGWDGVFCEDYLTFPPGEHDDGPVDTYDVWITLALAARSTSRVTLGPMVTPVPLRHAAQLAVQALTVDHLSGGRLVLGVGSGDAANLAAAGALASARERARRLDESLDTITRLWDTELRPRSAARPRIPIWVGGALTRPGPRRRALRWDGSCLYRIPTAQGWQDVTPDDVRALRADAPSGFTIVVGGRERSSTAAGLEADRRYLAGLAEAGADWFQEYVPPRLPYEEARRRIEGGPLG